MIADEDLNSFLLLLQNTMKYIETNLQILIFKEDQTTYQILFQAKFTDQIEQENAEFSLETVLQRQMAEQNFEGNYSNEESQYLLQSNALLQKMLAHTSSVEFDPISQRRTDREKIPSPIGDAITSNGPIHRKTEIVFSGQEIEEQQNIGFQLSLHETHENNKKQRPPNKPRINQNAPEIVEHREIIPENSLKRRLALDDRLLYNNPPNDVSSEKISYLQTQATLPDKGSLISPASFEINQYYFPSTTKAAEYQNKFDKRSVPSYNSQPQSAKASFQGTAGFRSVNNPNHGTSSNGTSSIGTWLEEFRKEIKKVELSHTVSLPQKILEGPKSSFNNTINKQDSLIDSLKALKNYAKTINAANESILDTLHSSQDRFSFQRTTSQDDSMEQLQINNQSKSVYRNHSRILQNEDEYNRAPYHQKKTNPPRIKRLNIGETDSF